jgi:hypothetical protein
LEYKLIFAILLHDLISLENKFSAFSKFHHFLEKMMLSFFLAVSAALGLFCCEQK